jgi:hypothetical protein
MIAQKGQHNEPLKVVVTAISVWLWEPLHILGLCDWNVL